MFGWAARSSSRGAAAAAAAAVAAVASAGAGAAALSGPAWVKRADASGKGAAASEAAATTPKAALSPNEFRALRVKSAETVSPNTKIVRFELPPGTVSGLTVASCVVAKIEADGKTVVRPYTPVSPLRALPRCVGGRLRLGRSPAPHPRRD